MTVKNANVTSHSNLDYAGWADKIAGQSFAEDNGVAKIVRYKPLGVCAGIASWNSTFMYVGWKLAPALAAGNTVRFGLK